MMQTWARTIWTNYAARRRPKHPNCFTRSTRATLLACRPSRLPMDAHELGGREVQNWRDKDEAAQELSEKTGTKLSSADALRCALDRGVRFVVYVPSGTKDRQSRPMERRLWELMTEGAVGEPGRLQVEHEINPIVSVQCIDGACVERDGVLRQFPQQPFPSAIPEGCTLGLRREDVEDLAETLNKEKPTPSAPKSADALDKPLKERERTTLLAIIAAMAAEAKIDLSHPTTVASSVVARLQLMGIRLGQTTVEGHLKKVIEASEKLKK